jgi:hypothetical protein
MDLYRQEYRHGQSLRSRDLSIQAEMEEQLRWWHNRAVHHAYGVVGGFAVQHVMDRKVVMVSAGLAYDAFGRPLQLFQDTELPLPKPCEQRAQKWMLVARVTGIEASEGNSEKAINKVCVGENRRTTVNRVRLEWEPERQFDYRGAVAIAIAEIDGDGNVLHLSRECLSKICGRGTPYLVNGETILGHTSWETWKGDTAIDSGVQVKVDTSAAGFTRSPIYIAQTTPFCFPFPMYVTDVSDARFTFRVVIPSSGMELLADRIFGVRGTVLVMSLLHKFVGLKWIAFEPVMSVLDEGKVTYGRTSRHTVRGTTRFL